jgi:cell division control protein 6
VVPREIGVPGSTHFYTTSEGCSNPLETYKRKYVTKNNMPEEDDPFGIKKTTKNQQSKVIENREKLKISHIPDQLKFREEEIKKIVNQLFVEALDGNEGQDAVITGEPGTGKTAVVKYVLNKLEGSYDTSRMDYAYVNCKTNNSKQEVFKAALNSLGMDFKRGVGLGENIDKLFQEYSDPEDNSLVIILDEVDELYKARREYINDVLYILSRPDEHSDGFQFSGSLNVVCVSNDNKLYDYLEMDVEDSSFSPEKFEFLTYTVDEITEILMERQKQAYREEVVDREYMEEIAEVVSSKFNGDIRVGIRILKKIPKNLDSTADHVDQSELVEKAIDDVKKSRIEKVLNGKDEHFLLVMAGMLQNFQSDKSRLSYIVDSYRGLCEVAGVEKNEDDFNKSDDESRARSRSYVRRKLEYLVEENILDKQKRYDKPRNPYFYEPTVDVELFLEMVEERLKTKGLEKIEEMDDSSFSGLDGEDREKLGKMNDMAS